MSNTKLNSFFHAGNSPFTYLKTYSGLQGEKLEELKQTNQQKNAKLERQLNSARYMERPKIQNEIKTLEAQTNLPNALIIDNQGQLHPTTTEIATIKIGDSLWSELEAILSEAGKTDLAAACIPVFRDAIAFYTTANQPDSIIYICFQCLFLKNEQGAFLEADSKTYQKLKQFLIKSGHTIAS